MHFWKNGTRSQRITTNPRYPASPGESKYSRSMLPINIINRQNLSCWFHARHNQRVGLGFPLIYICIRLRANQSNSSFPYTWIESVIITGKRSWSCSHFQWLLFSYFCLSLLVLKPQDQLHSPHFPPPLLVLLQNLMLLRQCVSLAKSRWQTRPWPRITLLTRKRWSWRFCRASRFLSNQCGLKSSVLSSSRNYKSCCS